MEAFDVNLTALLARLKARTYKLKGTTVKAEQWLQVQYDTAATSTTAPIYHLGVGHYRRPDIGGQQICGKCGQIYHVHGWIEATGASVCPGDYVLHNKHGILHPMKPFLFEVLFEIADEGAEHGNGTPITKDD